MEFVLDVLRGSCGSDFTAPEWEDALRLAERENVLPYFVAQARRSGATIPPEVERQLAAAERAAATSAFWWTCELRGVLEAFATHHVPVLLLKGSALAARIYGDARLRTSRDIDLLVQRSDLAQSGAILAAIGYTADFIADDYHQSWRRGTTLLELHFEVENPLAFDFGLAGAWSRSQRIVYLGQPARQFAAADELLFLCLHGVRHRFERLSHVLDLALAMEVLASQIDRDRWKESAPAERRRLVMLGLRMAEKLDPQCNPAGWRPELPRPAMAHLEAVADECWNRLLTTPGEPLNWESQHAFYLATEVTAIGRTRRRLRHALILSTRLIQVDFDFAARYRVRQVGLVWVLRQFRLIAERFVQRVPLQKKIRNFARLFPGERPHMLGKGYKGALQSKALNARTGIER